MTKILITGFDPFTTGQGLTLTENPTAGLAEGIAETLDECISAVLPVSFVRTKTVLTALFEQHQPQIWLGLGYAPHRTLIDIEYVALNIEHALRGDNDGATPHLQAVCDGGPNALFTRLPVDLFVDRMKAVGLPVQIGLHAGAFLCNQTFYLGCHEVEANGQLLVAGFIHVPPNIDAALFTTAVSECLKQCIKERGND